MKNKKSDHVYCWGLRYIEERLFSNDIKMPSEHTICRLLNCSRETVRIAYNRLEQEGLITRRQGSGTFICKDKALEKSIDIEHSSLKIALILQGRTTSPSDLMIKGIQNIFQQHHVDTHIYLTDNKFSHERKLLETVNFQGYAGFIIDGVCSSLMTPNLDYYKQLFIKKIPVIFYNNYYQDISYPKVIIDNQRASSLLVQELIRAGHRNIASIFVYDNIQSIEKFKGVLSTLRRHHIEYFDEYVQWIASGDLLSNNCRKKIKHFLYNSSHITAIICGNYKIYMLIKDILKENNKLIPYDLSVVCFDCPADKCEKEALTCTVHRGYDLGVHIAEQMIKMLKHHSIDEKEYSYKMSPLLYIGKSIKDI